MEDQVVRTARVAGETVAWAVVGTGPPVVLGGWWCSHLELNWQDRAFRDYLSPLAARHSVIRYDRPGTGPLSVEAEVAVLAGLIDALELPRVAVIGGSTGAGSAAAYAATRPDRVSRLVLYGGFARGADIAPPDARDAMLDVVSRHWGLGSRVLADVFLPGATSEERAAFARFQRRSATREQAAASLAATYSYDVTGHLGRLRLPTTVIHRRGDRAVPFALGVDLARRVRGAALVELDGVDHFPWRGDVTAATDAMLRGLGHHVSARPQVPGPESLSAREREVLGLVAAGMTDAQIADRLVVSPHTVHRHIANARAKLGVRSRAAAAAAVAQRKRDG